MLATIAAAGIARFNAATASLTVGEQFELAKSFDIEFH